MLILFTVRSYSESDFLELARVYKSAFAEPPWDEFRKCIYCEINYSIQESINPLQSCKQCKNPLELVEFWSDQDIKKDLDYALSQPQCRILVAASQGSIKGFTWGYSLPLLKFPFLEGKVDAAANYMDEIAVEGNSRRQGIGKTLGLQYIEICQNNKIPEIVLRTDKRNSSSMKLFSSLGFESLGITDPQFSWRIYLSRRLS